MTEIASISIDTARQLVVEHAQEVTDSGGRPRKVIHCLTSGPASGDWDLTAALDLLNGAMLAGWLPHVLRHDLAVVAADEKLYRFAVQMPAGADGRDAVVVDLPR